MLMKESVLSFEEKTTQPSLTYFQIAGHLNSITDYNKHTCGEMFTVPLLLP